jgi:hypothetical protein
MRRLAVGLLVTIPVLFSASPAFAAKPTMFRHPLDQRFVDDSCGFDVRVHITGVVVDIQWNDASGETLRDFQTYPQLTLTLTNQKTGRTITTSLGGPLHSTFNPDGSGTFVGTGHSPWMFNPETGDPGLFLTEGRWVLAFDAQGNASFSIVGHIVALCPKLAG